MDRGLKDSDGKGGGSWQRWGAKDAFGLSADAGACARASASSLLRHLFGLLLATTSRD